MKINTLLPAIAGLSVGVLLSALASATTLERYSLTDLVEQSELGVVGEVSGTEQVYVEGRFQTIVTISVGETLFGPGASTVQVRYPGGTAEINGVRIGESVPSAPPRMEGAEAVYFLGAADSQGVRDIVGFTQGQLDIATRGDQRLVSSPDQASPVAVDDFVARARALRFGR